MQSFADAQRLIISGFPFHRVRHFLLRIDAPLEAGTFLTKCADVVTRADRKLGEDAVSVALTRHGLEALQLPSRYLETFRELAPAFFEGAAARGARHLGDTGRCESPRWDAPFRSNRTHILVSIHADDVETIERRARSLREFAIGLSGWDAPLDAAHLGTDKSDRREPFGFRDGVSQPVIAGTKPKRADRSWSQNEVAPGEFLLGHPNVDGENEWAGNTVPADVRQFVANGSFGALRKMQQHVDQFMKVTDAKLRAKICGRWPSGALIRESDAVDPGVSGALSNDFDFSHDPEGRGCPFGSHIRRMNPRSDPVRPPTPPLMRRGVPYKTAGEEGLLGLFLCSSLERQFEFLLRDWARTPPMNPLQDSSAADPLIGNSPGALFRDGPDGPPAAIPNLGTYVTTRGTLYCFLPSASALAMIGPVLTESKS